jgi:hypothetical protein
MIDPSGYEDLCGQKRRKFRKWLRNYHKCRWLMRRVMSRGNQGKESLEEVLNTIQNQRNENPLEGTLLGLAMKSSLVVRDGRYTHTHTHTLSHTHSLSLSLR